MTLLLSILLLTMCSIALGCSNHCKQTPQQCKICYSGCEQQQLVQCSSTMGILTQQQCLVSCCQNKTLSQCIQMSREMPQKLSPAAFKAIIIICCVVFVGLVVLVVREIYFRCVKKKQRTIVQISRVQPDVTSEVHQENSRLDLEEKKQKKTVQTMPVYKIDPNFPVNCLEILQNDYKKCCICLDQGSNAVTKCGHGFHAPCLAAWSDRKDLCPLCTIANIYEVKIFCSNCFSQKGVVDFRQMNKQQLNRFLNSICEFCVARE